MEEYFHEYKEASQTLKYEKTLKLVNLVILGLNLFLMGEIGISCWYTFAFSDQLMWLTYPFPPGSNIARGTLLYICLGSSFGNLIYFMMLEFFAIIALILTREFHEWNDKFHKNINKDDVFIGDLTLERLAFEKLVSLMQKANDFLSPVIAMTFLLVTPTLCFVSYCFITGILHGPQIEQAAVTITVSLIIVIAVCTGGCSLNKAVSILYYRHLSNI